MYFYEFKGKTRKESGRRKSTSAGSQSESDRRPDPANQKMESMRFFDTSSSSAASSV
jgi:hypothetical protein